VWDLVPAGSRAGGGAPRTGFGVQAATTGEGALGSLAKFANNFAPELLERAEEAVGVA